MKITLLLTSWDLTHELCIYNITCMLQIGMRYTRATNKNNWVLALLKREKNEAIYHTKGTHTYTHSPNKKEKEIECGG